MELCDHHAGDGTALLLKVSEKVNDSRLFHTVCCSLGRRCALQMLAD